MFRIPLFTYILHPQIKVKKRKHLFIYFLFALHNFFLAPLFYSPPPLSSRESSTEDVQFIMSVNFRVYVTPFQTLQITAVAFFFYYFLIATRTLHYTLCQRKSHNSFESIHFPISFFFPSPPMRINNRITLLFVPFLAIAYLCIP